MILALAALMMSAAGAVPAPVGSGRTNDSAPAPAIALADNSQLFPDATHDANTTIVAASVDGAARLDVRDVKFDRNASPVMSASLTNREKFLKEAHAAALADATIPDPSPAREHRVTPAVSTPARRMWLALAFAEHGAAGFDAYSTRISIGHGNVEDNPLMRPFAHSPAIYLATQVTPVVMDFVARRMQRSEYGMLRRVWWLPQSLSTGASIWAGVHNLNLAAEK